MLTSARAHHYLAACTLRDVDGAEDRRRVPSTAMAAKTREADVPEPRLRWKGDGDSLVRPAAGERALDGKAQAGQRAGLRRTQRRTPVDDLGQTRTGHVQDEARPRDAQVQGRWVRVVGVHGPIMPIAATHQPSDPDPLITRAWR